MVKRSFLSLVTVSLCLAVPLSGRSVPEDTRLSPLVPVKNGTDSVGQNVTAHCEVPADFSIEAVVVTKGVKKVLIQRYQFTEDSEHVWLTGCNNSTDCHDLVITILVADATSFGTYEVFIKYLDGKIKTKSICNITVMPPPASDNLTVTPTAEALTAEAPTTEAPTIKTPTTAMSTAVIAGITIGSVFIVLGMLVGGVLLFIKCWRKKKESDQTGDNPAGQYELQPLKDGPHREDNGNTSNGGPY